MKVEINKKINLEGYKKITDLKIKEKINNGYIVSLGDKYSIISLDGKRYEYTFLNYQYEFKKTLIKVDDYHYILLDDNFNKVASFTAQCAIILDDNLIEIIDTNNNSYLMDFKGCILCNRYNYLETIDNNKKFIAKSQKYGVLDLAGNIIIPFLYSNMEYKNNYIVGYKKGHHIFFDTTGKELFDIKSKNLTIIGENLFLEHYSNYDKIRIIDNNKNVLFKTDLKKIKIRNIGFSIYTGFYSNKKLVLWADNAIVEKYIVCNDKVDIFSILQSKKINDKYYFIVRDKNSSNTTVYDNTATNITKDIYSVAQLTDFANIFYVEKNNKYGVIKDNLLLIDYIYDTYIELPSLIGLQKGNTIDIFNENLDLIMEFKVDDFKGIEKINNFYLIRKSKEQALYTLDGYNIVPFTDSNIVVLDNNNILIDNHLINLDYEYTNLKYSNNVKVSLFDNTVEKFFETESEAKEFINYASDVEKEYNQYVISAKNKLIKYKK